MKKNFLARIRGFSLIELLISLMIISVITAAFAPIISKKINKGSMGVSANKVKTDCPEDKYGTNCQMCDSNKCLFKICTNTCAGNQYRDDSTCACVNCSTFGDDCLSCDSSGCLATKSAANCPENCKECDEYGRCTSCKSSNDKVINGLCIAPNVVASQSDCDKVTNYNSIYIPNDVDNPDEGGFCVHRRNAGDYGGPSIDSPYVVSLRVSSNTNDSCNTNLCCFIGGQGRYDIQSHKTSTDTCTNRDDSDNLTHVSGVGVGDYGACNRTVCNWDAAAYICEKYSVGLTNAGDWALPTKTQLEAIKNAIEAGPKSAGAKSTAYKLAVQKFSGSAGMQLCASKGEPKNTGSHRCSNRTEICPFMVDEAKMLAPAVPSRVWGMNDGINDCDTSGNCTTRMCNKKSPDCEFECDKAKRGTKAWNTSPCINLIMSCNKKCSDRKDGYIYTNYKSEICLEYKDAPASYPVLKLTGDDTNKTTNVTMPEYEPGVARRATGSVRCVVSQYFANK